MHELTMELMRIFVRDYIHDDMPLDILDVGSADVNGNYRGLFLGHRYVGLDIVEAPNVDIVTNDPYSYPIPDNTYDVVISGQVIEHVEDIHRWIKEVARVTKVGGLVCVTGPNTWGEHRHPVDCWRIFPDGLKWLMETIGGLTILSVAAVRTDTIGVGRKDG